MEPMEPNLCCKSPCCNLKWVFRSGGPAGSIFSLIAATLGTGVISFAYAIMKNGYILGPVFVLIGALLSLYSGMIIVKAVEYTGMSRFEDIAEKQYGPRMAKLVSVFNIICLVGFTFSYIVFVKNELCEIVSEYSDHDSWVYTYLSTGTDAEGNKIGYGDYVWGCLYTFVILFPMSLPREINALRFSSFFGVLCSMYLALAVMLLFFARFNPDIVPSIKQNFQ